MSKRKKAKHKSKFSWPWLGIFIVFSVITLTITTNKLDFEENSIYTVGEIVDYIIEDEGDSEYESYWPIIQFSDRNGYVYEFKSTKAEFEFKKDDKRNVRYSPDPPNNAVVADAPIWGDVVLLATLSLFFLLKGFRISELKFKWK